MSAILLLRDYEMTPAAVHHDLVNKFSLSHLADKGILENYFILYWESKYFFESMHQGTIERNGTKYLVVYQECKPWELRTPNTQQIALSFRRAIPEYKLPAYVIVRKSTD